MKYDGRISILSLVFVKLVRKCIQNRYEKIGILNKLSEEIHFKASSFSVKINPELNHLHIAYSISLSKSM